MEQNILIIIGTFIVGIIVTAIKTGFTSFLSDKIKKVLEVIIHKDFDGKQIEYEVDEIKSRLYEIKTLCDADRVTVNRFHNGTNFLPNKPAWKVSRVYEICSSGVSYEADNVQNIMAMLIWDSINAIFEKNKSDYVEIINGYTCDNCQHIYKYDISKMNESYAKILLRNQGIVNYIQVPLRHENNIVGYIGIDYLSEKDVKIDACKICEKVNEISFILNR